MRVDRHLAPEQQGHAAGGAALFEDALGVGHALLVLRQKQHRHAVIALFREDLSALLGLLAKEAVRDLEEDAGAVAGVALEPDAAAVLEVDEDGEGVVENLVALVPVDARERSDAAGVVLEFGTPEGAGRICAGGTLFVYQGLQLVHGLLQSRCRWDSFG